MLREILINWWWWRQYKPSWSIVRWGNIEIIEHEIQGNVSFEIRLPITIKYRSGSAKYKTNMDERKLWIHIYHSGTGIDRVPFKLSIEDWSGSETLKAGETKEVNYMVRHNLKAKPSFHRKHTTHCKLINQVTGYIDTGQIRINGNYKKIGKDESDAKIIWQIAKRNEGQNHGQ